MNYYSTRGESAPVPLGKALLEGLAPDGGLYLPERWPRFEPARFDGAETVAEIGTRLLSPFFAGSKLEPALAEICEEALDFPILQKRLAQARYPVSVLELFHGPTAAFKDVGARFLAACMQRLETPPDTARPLTILVATSGDTGGAVAAAFHRRPGFRVVILFPEGQVSPRQAHQLTCWGGNVTALAVRGAFDDCQRLVKAAFADPGIRNRHRLCSANSINIGRLLPQAVYYAASSLWYWRETGEPSSYVVPTGNLGNALACVMARHMGLPIARIVFATNANTTIPEYLESGEYRPRPSRSTLASAMDVGNPSNMERLRHLWPEFEHLRELVSARSVSDEEIREQIVGDYRRHREIWCPHTATAARVYDELPDDERRARHWVLVATAHPAKFETIVEPLVDAAVPVPPALAALLERPASHDVIPPELERLAEAL